MLFARKGMRRLRTPRSVDIMDRRYHTDTTAFVHTGRQKRLEQPAVIPFLDRVGELGAVGVFDRVETANLLE